MADSIQSKSGIHSYLNITCRGKTTIRVVHVLFAVVIIFVALAFIMPHLGTFKPDSARFLRMRKLQLWHEDVEAFIQEKKRPPRSLFEMCQENLKQGTWPFPRVVVSVGQVLPEEFNRTLANDPNKFAEIIEYRLFVDQHGWLIRELKPGEIYKKMLMIDQDGKIYVVEEIPEEQYSKP